MSRRIFQTKSFSRAVYKLTKRRRIKYSEIDNALYQLSQDPFSQTLHTHKIVNRNREACYSSRIDMDLRMIWNYDENDDLILIMLDIGGHSGSSSVY